MRRSQYFLYFFNKINYSYISQPLEQVMLIPIIKVLSHHFWWFNRGVFFNNIFFDDFFFTIIFLGFYFYKNKIFSLFSTFRVKDSLQSYTSIQLRKQIKL